MIYVSEVEIKHDRFLSEKVIGGMEMINDFIYDIPVRLYFGKEQMKHLGTELKKYGKKVLLVYGGGSIKRMGLYDRVVEEIKTTGLELCELSGVEPNPRVDSVRKGSELCKAEGVDVVLAVGGGSVMDCAKWIAAGAKADFDPWDFFSKWAPVKDALPLITVPTVAATGSEMDAGGVISNPDTLDKIGRGDALLLPKAAFEDPTNTFTCSAYQTACGSADIISHIIEVYFNMNQDFDMLDSFMEGMMRSVIKYTPVAIEQPDDYKARAELFYASTWAINGFVNGSKQLDWSCHPIEHEISAIYDITHGLGLAILTPRWMRYCLSDATVSKYVQFAENVFEIRSEGLSDMEIAIKGIDALEEFFFEISKLSSSLSEIDIDDTHFDVMAAKSVGGENGILQGFVPLKKQDVLEILHMCL